jgi:hypothetical protein
LVFVSVADVPRQILISFSAAAMQFDGRATQFKLIVFSYLWGLGPLCCNLG